MPDASHDFGAHLRQAREQKGVSLRDISQRTKIAMLALEALERNDVSRLPGGIFTRAFVRSYAREVGLDPEDTVRRFLARFPEESIGELPAAYEANPAHIETDETPTFGRAWRAVAWSVPILLGVAYFGFGGRLPFWRDRPAVSTQTRTAQEDHPASTPPASVVQAPDQAAAQPAPASQTTPATPSSDPVPPGGQPAVATAMEPVSPARVPDAAPGVTAPVPAQPGGSRPAAAGSFRLTLAPRESCWVSVRVAGASVFSQLMRAGERKELTLDSEASLTVGNAGAFEFLLNDQPGRSLGGPGQVVTARLNVENLRTFLEPR